MAVPALILPISGPYVGDLDAAALGIMNDDGFELRVTVQGQEVNETDAYGMTLIEGVYRGQNWRVLFRGLEWNKPGILTALQAFGWATVSTVFNPTLDKTAIGDRYSAYGQTLLLTAILGDPPTVPQTLTAMSAVIAPNSQSQFNMTSKVRELPIEMVLLPYSTAQASGEYAVPFTTT